VSGAGYRQHAAKRLGGGLRAGVGRERRSDSLGPIVVCHGDEAPPSGAFAARETPEKYLEVEGRINGCGVYEYEDAQGNRWGELRLPEHVKAAVPSWDSKALTDDHPPVWLDASNTSQYQRGTVSNPRFNHADEYTYARLLVTDAATIAKIRAGKCELSCGYSHEPQFSEGALDGKTYSVIQTGIYGNHVSVVDVARGGPLCSLIFDGVSRRRGSPMKTSKDGKIMIGEVEYDVPDEVAAEFEALHALLAEPKPDEDEAKPPAEPEKAADHKEMVRLRAKVDALTVRVEREAKAREAGERGALLEQARAALGPDANIDAKASPIDIKRKVARASFPELADKIDTGTADYVDGMFEASIASPRVDTGAVILGAARGAGNTDSNVLDLNKIAAEQRAKKAN
jgi:hypothetical protein